MKRVLVVDDDPGDIRMAEEALRKFSEEVECFGESNPATAVKRIRALKPHLVLLDLNMPGIDGFQILEEMRDDDLMRAIPVIVLSSSHNPQDVQGSYLRYANAYVAKPMDLDDFVTVFHDTAKFWMERAELPKPVAPNSA